MAEMEYGGVAACDAQGGYHLREIDMSATPSPEGSWRSSPFD